MATVILQALDPYLIPPLADIILEYLVITYTLTLTEPGDRDIQVRCEIAPLRNHFTGTYITKLVDDSVKLLDKLRSRGWTLQELPGRNESKDLFATKSAEGPLDTFGSFAAAVVEDPEYLVKYTWRIHTTLTTTEGWCREDTSVPRYQNSAYFVEGAEKFVGEIMACPMGVDVLKVWALMEQFSRGE